MKKIILGMIASVISLSFLALTSFAHDGPEPHEGKWHPSHSGKVLTASGLSCIRTAVSTREVGVRSAYLSYSNATISALDARAKALDTAWTMTGTTERWIARDRAWEDWRKSSKENRDTFRTARKTAWENFRKSVQSCWVHASQVETYKTERTDVQ